MNIKLIVPFDRFDTIISSAETFKVQQSSLPLLAAYTPAEHSVKIVDESFAPDDVDEDVDLVGITVMTDLALRAYQIADTYRHRGVKVVMGGIHPTVLPGEALEHADAVVLGEGEEVWQQLLSDAAEGRMRKVYRASWLTDMTGRPLPRRDLYPNPVSKGYTPLTVGLEASRGCPFNCEFCSVGRIMGHKYRQRPIREVISEIESIDIPNLFFVDDNFALNRRSAKELFTEMIPLKRRWVGQGAVALAEDRELLGLMRRSGCKGLLIGFESIQKKVQDTMRKTRSLKIDYCEAVKRFHGEGIAVLGAFVFGFDNENKDVFDQTLEFSLAQHIDFAQLRILIPYPGTRLYRRLLEEGRLFMPDWWLKGINNRPNTLLFRPKGMTPDELINGVERLNKQFYSIRGIISRFFGVNPLKRTAASWHLYAGANLANRKRYCRDNSTWL